MSEEEEVICKFMKEARENKKAIGTKSVVAFAVSINSSFKNKAIHTQLMWCYRFIKRWFFGTQNKSCRSTTP